MNNPFVYGKEVSGYQFYDRTNEAEELYRYMKDGSTNIVLYAPRRYGKTSLVHKVLTRLRAEGCDCLLFDVSKPEQFDESYRLRYGLGGISTVHSALRGLLERGHVETVKRSYAIGDPFFARYIREMSASRCY